jgi:hypothetical protein
VQFTSESTEVISSGPLQIGLSFLHLSIVELSSSKSTRSQLQNFEYFYFYRNIIWIFVCLKADYFSQLRDNAVVLILGLVDNHNYKMFVDVFLLLKAKWLNDRTLIRIE